MLIFDFMNPNPVENATFSKICLDGTLDLFQGKLEVGGLKWIKQIERKVRIKSAETVLG